MKQIAIYQCETCGKGSSNSHEIAECEAKHLGLTVEEKNEYDKLQEEVRLRSYNLNEHHNEKTLKAFDDAVEAVISFERDHELRKHLLVDIVMRVRARLIGRYNILHGSYKDFAGLGYVASRHIEEAVESTLLARGARIREIHGAQNPALPGCRGIEHTWLEITWGDIAYYVDATCQQFREIYPDIPDYYISTEPPKWFLTDCDNPKIQKLKAEQTHRFS